MSVSACLCLCCAFTSPVDNRRLLQILRSVHVLADWELFDKAVSAPPPMTNTRHQPPPIMEALSQFLRGPSSVPTGSCPSRQLTPHTSS